VVVVEIVQKIVAMTKILMEHDEIFSHLVVVDEWV
jgi:hypothetical protein